jgi:hypothetical protein
MLSIMSDHYPYKLSLCAFQSLPWVVRTAMNVAWPFADAALKENVKFDKNLVKDGDVDRAVLMKPLGGDLDVSFPWRMKPLIYIQRYAYCEAYVPTRSWSTCDASGGS